MVILAKGPIWYIKGLNWYSNIIRATLMFSGSNWCLGRLKWCLESPNLCSKD